MVSNTMFILVIAFAAMFSSLSMAQIFDTSVALKGSYREGQRYIAENAHTFKDLLRRGSMFVDKTLLLKVILDDFRNTTVSINYPPKWGKTINLNMIKTFLEIEVDKEGNRISPPDLATNYRLFKSGELVLSKGMQVFEKPFLITQHADIMDKFLGQRPVVYLNFSALNAGAGFNDLCTEIANRISQSFAEHEYMKQVFTKVVNDKSKPNGERDQATENLKMFEKILSKKGNITEVQKSLNFLSSILTNHFKRKAFLLIDDYDTPFNLTFLGDLPRSEDPVFLNFYRKFMYFTVVSNAHVKKTILTGVLPLLKGTLFHPINNSIEYTVLNDTEIHKYYGFSKPDVEQLFQLHETSEKTRQKVYKFFDGYRVSGNSCRTNILETSAVIHLIHSEDIIRTDGHFFRKYFAIDSIRQVLHCLISGLNLPVGIRNITLNRNDFRNLQSAQLYNEVYNGPIVESFLRYSMAAGFITLTEFKLLGKYCVRLANRDISAAIKEGLGRYFTSEFGSNTSKINGHAQHFYTEFVSFTRTENATSEKLKSILEEAYSYVFLPYGSVANENERMAHLVLDYLCTFLKPFKRYPSYSTAILLIDKDAGVIVETTFNKATADEALQKAIRSLLSFYPFRPVKMKYIGINVKADSKVDIATE